MRKNVFGWPRDINERRRKFFAGKRVCWTQLVVLLLVFSFFLFFIVVEKRERGGGERDMGVTDGWTLDIVN